ncbi:MAG: SagB/ThcOx family dehydrogenase [Alphaproteobacteria bacterium]|nr:SagB/ThcOx family dehydrogenase [Alphaproteobacteria bacterium]
MEPAPSDRLSRRGLFGLFALGLAAGSVGSVRAAAKPRVKLPKPRRVGRLSVEEGLAQRRSVRSYRAGSVTLSELGQLLWAAQGINRPPRLRTAPSAGALYPLELYVVAGRVAELAPGIYRYDAKGHALVERREGDLRRALSAAALGQSWVQDGAAALVFCAAYARITGKYGDRGVRYAHIEAGHAAQNVYLQATALGLGTVVVGAFRDRAVRDLVAAGHRETPLLIMPVGRT